MKNTRKQLTSESFFPSPTPPMKRAIYACRNSTHGDGSIRLLTVQLCMRSFSGVHGDPPRISAQEEHTSDFHNWRMRCCIEALAVAIRTGLLFTSCDQCSSKGTAVIDDVKAWRPCDVYMYRIRRRKERGRTVTWHIRSELGFLVILLIDYAVFKGVV